MIEGIEVPPISQAMQQIHQAINDFLGQSLRRFDDSTGSATHPFHHRHIPKFPEPLAIFPPFHYGIIQKMLEMVALAVIQVLTIRQEILPPKREGSYDKLTR